MSIIFKFVLTENLTDILIAISCKKFLQIRKNQFTSDSITISSTFVKTL